MTEIWLGRGHRIPQRQRCLLTVFKKERAGGKGKNPVFASWQRQPAPFYRPPLFTSEPILFHKYDHPKKGQAGRALTLGQRDTLALCFAVFFGFFVERVGYFVPPSLSSSDSSISKCWHFNLIQIPLPSFLSFPFSVQISLVDLQFTLRSLISFAGKSLSMYRAGAFAANWSSFTFYFQWGM